MLDAVLVKRNLNNKLKITVKSAVSACIVALAVILPQIVHIALGATGGAKFLPMYLPVLIGGCLLGFKWGLCVGVISPLVSFLLTLAFGNPMPAALRLPYLSAELAVYGAVSGLFADKIAKNAWMAFLAALTAAAVGRCAFLAIAAAFQTISPITAASALAQVQTGLIGLVLQAVIAPSAIMALSFVVKREKR